ncbi:MAG TPA: sigma-70 family RNA polymerase sigma factor [Longimicrobiales bacterium]
MDYDDFFRRVYPSLFRYLHRLTGDEDSAEDIAQESFVRLLRQRLPEQEARPWLFTVAMNLLRDSARKTARRERLLVGAPVAPSAAPAPDVLTERREAVDGVRAALAQLPERDRRLLLMREEGFSYNEIAGVIGVAPGSVGTLLARALRRFSAVYRMHEVEEDAHQ